MKYILTADIGTTTVKVVLVDEEYHIIDECSHAIHTHYDGKQIEQNPEDWYEAFCSSVKAVLNSDKAKEADISAADIRSICFSGQMQDLILIGKDGKNLRPAILYSDTRGDEQARDILEKLTVKEVQEITGNHFDGSMPFAKLLWLKENEPDQFSMIDKIVFSAKDYIVYRLTGICVTDVICASTTGLMSIREKKWQRLWMEAFNINDQMLPLLQYPSELVGNVSKIAEVESGLLCDTEVFTGIGDAGATTLASGLTSSGEYNVNLGTSGWVASVSDDISKKDGIFNMAYVTPGTYINVVPVYNAGNVHNWISRTIATDDAQEDRYGYIKKLLEESVPGSHGTLFLPYLIGERYPVADDKIRGAFIGITPETTKQDMARACLEGVAFSLKGGFKGDIKTISLIGGGAKERIWCQIFSDIMNHDIIVFENAEYMPSVAVAAMADIGSGKFADWNAFMKQMKDSDSCEVFSPDGEAALLLNEMYETFQKIYPALKSLY